jgi:AraC family transcriptional regulator
MDPRVMHPNRIHLLQANGELVPANIFFRVVQSSADSSWRDVVMEQHQIPSNEWANLMYQQHVVAVNVGWAMDCEFKSNGRFQQVTKLTGAISFFPSCQPFFLRVKMGVNKMADLIFLALDPKLLMRTADRLELRSDRIELVEQRRPYDPTLFHLALALREGVLTGAAADPLYGEALSSALSLHLLREYTTLKPKLKQAPCNLSRETLLRAIAYIQDQLAEDLTLSHIAEAVSMSPFHFARRFKEATGKSPHQFVIEARVSKAKHLLERGDISIGEVAYEVGFVDQSHLTRHFKRMYGLPPRALLRSGVALGAGGGE